MRIITNADDFGQDDDTVTATIECFEVGALTSASIMPRMAATQRAIDFARQRPDLSFGVHLTFVRENDSTGESPLCSPADVPELTDVDGRCLPSDTVRWRALFNRVSVEQIEREMRAQIELVRDHGIPISHVDSHGHLHKFGPFREALRRTLPHYGIARVRSAQDVYLTKPIKSPTYWFGGRWRRQLRSSFQTTEHLFMPGGHDQGWGKNILDHVEGHTLEVGVHPGHAQAWRDAERREILVFAADAIRRGHTLVGWNKL
jgi:predicted glycoside hydrolase/deacetylase ChbG (UPF0249 family)